MIFNMILIIHWYIMQHLGDMTMLFAAWQIRVLGWINHVKDMVVLHYGMLRIWVR